MALSQKKLAIIATKGTLDWAYPPFILASVAAALDYQVEIFFTFYGLQLVRKDLSGLKVSPLGNPGMPMKMPFGPKWFRGITWNVPNAIQALVPGYESFATAMMKKTIANNGVDTVGGLRDICLECEVKFVACQMTVDLFGFSHDDFIGGMEYAGAAAMFEFAGDSDICLFI